MRLINVKTLELEEFFYDIPPYAILSHTWGQGEVTFQDYLLGTGPSANKHVHITRKAGFLKIVGACKRAHADGLQYLWCDTNCINKSSSAELSESINSMYAWYCDSVVCYAYLADVGADVVVPISTNGDMNPGTFKDSRWFTRGWTLQELLAPKKVVFFDRQWRAFGDRGNLADIISKTTRIHIGALRNPDTVPEYSIAQRMSWAAGRQTSRQEDIAYCLLGIFNINMPLLYGEGHKAFLRFQQEIIKTSDDQSLLAWVADGTCNHLRSGILAPSPHVFQKCGSIVRDMSLKRMPFSFTNVGLCVKVPVIGTALSGIVIAGLNCAYELRRYSSNIRHGPNQNPPHPVQITGASRRVKVWIWLWSLQHEVYERAHFPTSIVCLEYSYPDSIGWASKEVFITPSLHSKPHFRADDTPSRNLDLSEAGFMITIGSGVMNSRHRLYDKSFYIGNFSIICLQERSPSGTSHVLVSDGTFSTLCSIAWDDQNRPQLWREFTFKDPKQEAYRRMLNSSEWCSIFGGGGQNCHIQGKKVGSPEFLVYVHECIRGLHTTVYKDETRETPPFVILGKEVLSDALGQTQIEVDIVFQEPPRTMNPVDVSRIFKC